MMSCPPHVRAKAVSPNGMTLPKRATPLLVQTPIIPTPHLSDGATDHLDLPLNLFLEITLKSEEILLILHNCDTYGTLFRNTPYSIVICTNVRMWLHFPVSQPFLDEPLVVCAMRW